VSFVHIMATMIHRNRDDGRTGAAGVDFIIVLANLNDEGNCFIDFVSKTAANFSLCMD